jgi:hypothetical protein
MFPNDYIKSHEILLSQESINLENLVDIGSVIGIDRPIIDP